MKRLMLLCLMGACLWAEEPLTDLSSDQTIPSSVDALFDLPPPSLEPAIESASVPSIDSVTEAPLESEPALKNQFILLEPKPPGIGAQEFEPIAYSQEPLQELSLADQEIAALEAEVNGPEEDFQPKGNGIVVDLMEVFSGSPTIYTVLLSLSVASLGVLLYTFSLLRSSNLLSAQEFSEIQQKLKEKEYNQALALCQERKTLLSKMIASGIEARIYGREHVLESIRLEGKRAASTIWQKISLLSDIAMIAPMLGLLGTVMGMFYAFYDLNRSMESISALFDGLGISVGTTVAGLVVAILAMIFHSMTKYRLGKQFSLVESHAEALANCIETSEAV